jgi:aminoglycoside phosphotransferase (APT) family kinase protein
MSGRRLRKIVLSQRLSEPVLRWVSDVVGARPIGSEDLAGATSSSVFSLTFSDGTKRVLRLHTNDDWLADEPDLAAREATALRALAHSSVVAPALIAVDEVGEFCGRPAILMTELAGKPDASNRSAARLRALAEALPPLHAQPIPDGLPVFAPYQEAAQRAVPAWTSIPDVWSAAIDLCASPSPSGPTVFLHRDYHPGNVLFEGDRLTGVVDWVNACAGPPEIDIAHCRINIALAHGVEAADEFAVIATGLRTDVDPKRQAYWDLVDCLDLASPDDTNPLIDEYVDAAMTRWRGRRKH